MMLFKNMKIKFRSSDGDTDIFDIVADVLQGDTLAPYLFIICLDYVLRPSIALMKENGFIQEKTLVFSCINPFSADYYVRRLR